MKVQGFSFSCITTDRRLMNKTLYILGNGFDLHFGLKTLPSDFCEILKSYDIYNEVVKADEVLLGYGVDWSQYEESLAEMDLEEIEEQQVLAPDYLSDHESDRDMGIYNMNQYVESLSNAVNEALQEMVDRANKAAALLKKPVDISFPDAEMIISFNYTSTFEILFERNVPILHVHGYHENGDHLIFGYKNQTSSFYKSLGQPDGDYYIEKQKEGIWSFYQSWKKELQLNSVREFINDKMITRVVVLGHSMGTVDSDYFEKIEEWLHPAEWIVFYHDKPIDVSAYSFSQKVSQSKW